MGMNTGTHSFLALVLILGAIGTVCLIRPGEGRIKGATRLEYWVATEPVSTGSFVVDEAWFDRHFSKQTVTEARLGDRDPRFTQDRWAEDKRRFFQDKWNRYSLSRSLKKGEVLLRNDLGLALHLHDFHTAYQISVERTESVPSKLVWACSWVDVIRVRPLARGTSATVLLRNVRFVGIDELVDERPLNEPVRIVLEITKKEKTLLKREQQDHDRLRLRVVTHEELECLSDSDRYRPENRVGNVSLPD